MQRVDAHLESDGTTSREERADAGRRLRLRLRVAAAALILMGVATVVLGYAGVLSASSGSPGEPPAGGTVGEAASLTPQTGPYAICPDCHALLDPPSAERPFLTDSFGHAAHLERGALCEDCHPTPVHTEQGTRRPGMADCFGCHSHDPGAAAPGDCAVCHPPDMPLVPSSHTPEFFDGGHAEVVALQGPRECFACHAGDEQTFCQACHGIALPHPESWTGTPGVDPGDHVDWAYQDAALCVDCHDNTSKPAPPGCYQGECHGP